MYIKTPLQRFNRLLSLDRKDTYYIYVYAFFAGLISLSIPLGIQAIINLVALGQKVSSWLVLVFIVSVGTALSGGMSLLQVIITETIQQRIFTRSAFEFAYRMPRLKMEDITDQYAPELANRFFDTLTIQKGIPKLLVDVPTAILQIFFGLVLLALYHVFFLIFGLVLILLTVVTIWVSYNQGLKSSIKESKYKYKVAFWLEELGRVMGAFKLAGKTDLPLERTDEYVVGYLKYRKAHFSVIKWQIIALVTLKTLATAFLLIIGGVLAMNGRINVGQFVASEIMVIFILNALEKIISSLETFFDVLTAIDKIGAVTDIELEKEKGLDFREIKSSNGISVQLHQVSYAPPGISVPVLKDISLEIEKGERVCIAGANASGKSVLLHIIMGLYNNFSGTLTYNGISKEDINVVTLRSYIGDYVREEALFHGTLFENISMGREKVTLQAALEACNKVSLTDYLKKSPAGFNTVIASDGEGLPQSIIRKILLARSIADKPQLLVAEDLFGGLQTKDKSCFLDILTDPAQAWTLVSVSRDRDFMKSCDRVIVLENGTISFNGTPQDLQLQPSLNALFV